MRTVPVRVTRSRKATIIEAVVIDVSVDDDPHVSVKDLARSYVLAAIDAGQRLQWLPVKTEPDKWSITLRAEEISEGAPRGDAND